MRDPEFPRRPSWDWLLREALREDLATGDATSDAVLPEGLAGSARIEAREPLVLCGLPLARAVFEELGGRLEPEARDGELLAAGGVAARVAGPARDLLAAERTALNFLQRLSGIATRTQAFVRAVAGTKAAIVDTRKTTPGWRALEKYAVRCGGGVNHRVGLYDGILIKDNHIAAVGSVGETVKRARERAPLGLRIQIEVTTPDEARAALDAGADALLIDNQPPDGIREIVNLVAGRAVTEASGGVRLETVADVARTGVDRISIGALTHSAPAADLAMEWEETSAS